MYNICCKGAHGGNVTESNQRCECVNECEMITFSTTISSGKLAANVILEDIPDSSDIPERFLTATETRHRVESSLMMKTVTLLTDAVEAHRLMRFQINTDIVDAGTSWTKALSKLLTSLDDMMLGHIADSISLLSILKDVHLKHANYLATGLSTQLEDCTSLIAEVHVIAIRAQLTVISSAEVGRLQLLSNCLQYLNTTMVDFDSMLNAEARKSPHQWHYFPSQMRMDDCNVVFYSVHDSLILQLDWLDSFIPTVGTIVSPVVAIIFTNMTVLGSNMASLSECLMSYKKELYSFEDELFPILTSTLQTHFTYEPPTTLLSKFSMDGHWLESITSRYVAYSLSKLELATALHVNGSEMVTDATRLYSDIELSLFTKVTDLIDKQQTSMVSFYSDLLQRVASLQRYMFANDTKLEEFMRRLSIWRMPIINFQKAKVSLPRSCVLRALAYVYDSSRTNV